MANRNTTPHRIARWGLSLALATTLAGSTHAATIMIVNKDGFNEGFNDNTPALPVGGNPGTTRGQQRLQVFQQAAAIWGALLPSTVTINVDATFDPLTPCDATSGVLGSAGPIAVRANFANAELPDTWYHMALANKLAGSDLNGAVDEISARFNSSVDNSTCLGTTNWYYGFDNNHGLDIDLLPVVLHELGHGLGFSTLVNLGTGVLFNGQADVYSHILLDVTSGLHWDQMDDNQRLIASTNTGNEVWDGPSESGHAHSFLGPVSIVRIDSPQNIFGEKDFGTAQFGPALAHPPVSGGVVLVDDGAAPTSDACTPIVNAAEVAGKIALIDRGACTFVAKTQAAQDAGAIAVIIVNNTTGVVRMGGEDPGFVIPVVSISQADGNLIKIELSNLNTVTATIGLDITRTAGENPQTGLTLVYTPASVEFGSSISHWDDSAFPNLLMEPFINSDLGSGVDLTRYAFDDIGWFNPRPTGVEDARAFTLKVQSSPNPFRAATRIHYTLASAGLAGLDVYDMSGRLVKRLVNGWRPAGQAEATWDGTNTTGRRVSPGVYLYRLRTNTTTQSGRTVLVK